MIKLKNKRIINLLSFCLLALVIFANTFFSIKNFGVIEQFDIIQKKYLYLPIRLLLSF
ncbi:hypothetical protein SIL09_13560 [Bacillus cereus group sp. BfR-BA-01033]|uniref:hypothetical protein n=1 Tax=Bacillus cereus group sp. BfR-BA-01033 TaxID=3094874 RepID=UPI0029C1E4AE|nr:hypothetical protein [Bacillus cereus group sp. BfR-BA-01033]MDX5920386.1 hypothetical protein [Bacillus cereus group sp. BfR-BA-01033]